jgi:hypothetical protein
MAADYTSPEDFPVGDNPMLNTMRIIDLMTGFSLSQAVYVVAKLDIPTKLSTGPRTAPDLAAETQVSTDHLRRILRTLASCGMFREPSTDLYELTPLGATLVADVPGSLRDMTLSFMESMYGLFGNLLDSVRTGVPAAEIHLGLPYWDWLSKSPEQAAQFTRAMAGTNGAMLAPFLDAYQLPEGRLVADLGGADGTLLAHFLAADPSREGMLFDRPDVVPAAEALFAERGLTGRTRVVGGDFLVGVPEGADIYLLKNILHDWNDEQSVKILRSVADAARPGARVLVIDFVVPAGDTPAPSKRSDLIMMATLGGKERTEAEFDALLTAAGITIDNVVPTPTYSVIEATLR